MKTRTLALPIALAALLLTGCSATSLDSIASDCGGDAAGVRSDDSGLVVEAGGEALTCVITKTFSDKTDQYSVAMAVDAGPGQETEVDGRSIKVSNLGGSTVVFIGAK
ncbi:hypothetical protein [Microbacterium sp. NPDC057944]|uniref:hypothetical protein n=1 Tax=Microbacterium sp. NPDC057944 TaxID=3346286 RepID=UPI0036DB8824